MIGYVFSALALVVAVMSSADVDWCSNSLMCYNNNRVYQHTMCLYKNQTNTPRCKNITNVQTYPGRFELLKKHNQLREFIATGQVGHWPAAAAMRKLSYDNVLEKIAYRWATQCQAGHDDCRKTKRWPFVGQNVYELKKDSPIDYKMWNPASVVDDWFQAVYVVQPQADGIYSGKDFGFVQMIHDKTEKLGCADVEYEVPDTEPRFRRLIVCNYGPGLEPDATELYEEGPTCSECPPGVRCLCGDRVLGQQESTTTPGETSTASATPVGSSTASATPGGSSTASATPGGSSTASATPGETSSHSVTPGDGSSNSTTPGGSSSNPTTTRANISVDTAPPDTPPPPTNSSSESTTRDMANYVDADPFKFTGVKGAPLIDTDPKETPSSTPLKVQPPSVLLIVSFWLLMPLIASEYLLY